MDAHYHIVMKAREAIKDTGTRLYFAYSPVLDREAFETWKEEHSYQFFNLPEGHVAMLPDMDLVFDFPSRWWGGRVAGIADKKGSHVYGRIFEIPANNWPVVQHKEGVITGMSVEKPVTVIVNGEKIQATAFATNPSRAKLEGEISQDYIEALVRGASHAGLPSEYIERIKNTYAK